MNTKSFIKRKEDFLCDNCGEEVKGTGYTNHCPKCLFSKHVDVNPGDRMADCGALMEPAGFEIKSGEYSVLLRCVRCGHERKNKIAENDDMEVLFKLSEKQAEDTGSK